MVIRVLGIGNTVTRSKLLSTFLDTSTEVHAAVHGIYAGLTEWKGAELPDDADIVKEPAYFKGGFICGTLIRWAFIIWLASMAT